MNSRGGLRGSTGQNRIAPQSLRAYDQAQVRRRALSETTVMTARNNSNNLPTFVILFVFLASLSVALGMRAADICDEVSFTPAQYFATGGSPLNVVVADFDSNGTQDFAVNNAFAIGR